MKSSSDECGAGGWQVDFRLFISHSSPTEESRERLRELAAKIQAAAAPETPVRVLVDEEQIASADDWRRRIAFMLHVCHGGLVLVDDAALSSQWVLAEATFLSLRHEVDNAFVFLPVSFLDEPDLEKAKQARAEQRRFLNDTAWDVVKLPAVQYVRGETPTEIADRIVSDLRKKNSLPWTVSPANRLASQLASKFEEASLLALRELADQISDAKSYLIESPKELAALAIVQHMLRCGQLVSTLHQMDRFGSAFPDAKRAEILEELAPLPLPAEAAAMLTRRRDSGGYTHAGLRTGDPSFIVSRYIRRAHLSFRPPEFFAIGNTFGRFDELQEYLRQECRQRLGGPPDDLKADKILNDTDLYVWVPGPIDTDVLTKLEQAYPRIAFIIHYAQDDELATLPAGVLPLTPLLEQADEDEIRYDYDRFQFLIKRSR
jgi:hypothetical protein